MMESLKILRENQDFLLQTYNVGHVMTMLVILAITDVGLKGWAMWRAARMQKAAWFIGLLIINSMGILPVIFLLMTRDEYRRFCAKASQPLPPPPPPAQRATRTSPGATKKKATKKKATKRARPATKTSDTGADATLERE